jgi:excisionase family DNA binding protein
VNKIIAGRAVTLTQIEAPALAVKLYGEWVRLEDARRLLDISRPTIKRWVDKGKLTRKDAGAKVYVRWADVERLMEQGNVSLAPVVKAA